VSVAGPLLLSSKAELAVPLVVLLGWLLLGMLKMPKSPLHLDLARREAYVRTRPSGRQSWVAVWEFRKATALVRYRWRMLESVWERIVLLT
jgi:hypothetical protein